MLIKTCFTYSDFFFLFNESNFHNAATYYFSLVSFLLFSKG